MNDLLGCLVALGVLAPFVLVIGGIYWDVYKTYEDEWDAKRRECFASQPRCTTART
jgi:hypothetical protein